jgi:Zn-dependent protease with chaperone function
LRKTSIILAFVLCVPFLHAQPASAVPAAPSTSAAAFSLPSVQAKITAYTLPPDLYRKARNRDRISFATHVFAFFYSLWILWFILQREVAVKYRNWAETLTRKRFVQAFIFAPLVVLTMSAFELPLDIFREQVLKTYRISIQPWPSWALDWAKSELLTMLAAGLLVWILYAMIRYSPRRWWLYCWLISLPLLAFVLFISPTVFEPIFNQYAPLSAKAPQLIPAIQTVTRKAGVEIPPERMQWMLASTKTVATNAYVSGFGSSKHVVIWDTTLAQETQDEVLTDFGHELGHYVLGHIPQESGLFEAMLFVLLYLGYRCIGSLLARRGAAWGIRGLDDWASLPALLLILTLFGFVADVAGNTYSRAKEHEADIYSIEITRGIVANPGQTAAHSFQKFGEIALEDPTPNPVRVFLFYDHPPVADRIRFFVTYDPWSKGEALQFVK